MQLWDQGNCSECFCLLQGHFSEEIKFFVFLGKLTLKRDLDLTRNFLVTPNFQKEKHNCECCICPLLTHRAICRLDRMAGWFVLCVDLTVRPVKHLPGAYISLCDWAWSIMVTFHIPKEHQKFYVFAFMTYLVEQ